MKNTPPKTLEEVGTHLFYMSKSLDKIEATLSDAPSRKDVDDIRLKMVELELAIEKIQESRNRTLESLDKKYVTKGEFKIGMGVVTFILSLAVTILTVWEKVRG